MIAEPLKSEGKYTMRGRVRIVVYRNSEEKNNKNVLAIEFGYSFPENEKALITIERGLNEPQEDLCVRYQRLSNKCRRNIRF